MSTLHETHVYQLRNERADHKHPGYGYFALVLVCMALALVFSSAVFSSAVVAPAPVSAGISHELPPLGP
jgi:hypothetical protein